MLVIRAAPGAPQDVQAGAADEGEEDTARVPRKVGVAPGPEEGFLDGVPREIVGAQDAQGSGVEDLHVGCHGRLEGAPRVRRCSSRRFAS